MGYSLFDDLFDGEGTGQTEGAGWEKDLTIVAAIAAAYFTGGASLGAIPAAGGTTAAAAGGTTAAAAGTSWGTYAMVGLSLGSAAMSYSSGQAAMRQQQNQINEYRNQQQALIRDEQNRRWQGEISNSWAAYGAQRRSEAMSGANKPATVDMSANDLYLGGR